MYHTASHNRVILGLAVLATAVLPLALSTLRAEAVTTCKPSPTIGTGLTQSQAVTHWKSVVTSVHGAAWSNFDIATGKHFSETNLGVATLNAVTARPCSNLVFVLPPGSLRLITPKP